jgi:hypothetical protein
MDFFTDEVWSASGLMTYYVSMFMRVGSRQIRLAGFTLASDAEWMKQMVWNLMAGQGMLDGCRYLTFQLPSIF